MSNVPRAWKSFLAHPMALQRDVGQVEAHFGPFGDSVNLAFGANRAVILRQD